MHIRSLIRLQKLRTQDLAEGRGTNNILLKLIFSTAQEIGRLLFVVV